MLDPSCERPEITLSDDDVYEAMRTLSGYLDITPADFRELYTIAFRQACMRISTSVTAGDIMTRPVISVRTDTPLTETADLMARQGISGLPVLGTDGAVAGVLSEKDFLRRLGSGTVTTFMGIVSECLHRDGCIAMAIRERTAGDIMTSPAITVPRSVALGQIIHLFDRSGINRVPVLDDAGQLAGIVTRTDVLRGTLRAQGRAGTR
jgi:CBS-domain-containing membrane protein